MGVCKGVWMGVSRAVTVGGGGCQRVSFGVYQGC